MKKPTTISKESVSEYREFVQLRLRKRVLEAIEVVLEEEVNQARRCCTALAEREIRLWWWPRYVSSMKYPKRCQYKHAKQKKYHVRNWAEYNEGLRRRGDLTVWFDEEAIANWKADKTGKPGGQRVYSDMAIETGLVVRMVYKLAYRQTEGFLHSIASLLGLGIEIPDYSCAPPVGLSLATRSSGVGSQPCGAKYPRFCADSKGV